MKKKRMFSGLFIGLFLQAFVGEARLVCEKPVFDYGTVSASDKVGHSFELKNTGTNTIKILKVRKTCGCMATVTSKKEVEPGGTAEIRLSVSLKGRSGAQSKTVYVHTSSPETPLLKLVAKGMVKRSAPNPVQARQKPATQAQPSRAPKAVSPAKSAVPRENQELYTVPHEIRLPRTVGPDGVLVRIEVKYPEAAGFRLKGILPPADISFAVHRTESECWVELGPIHNVQALKGSALVIITTRGALRVPCTVEE